MLMMRFCLMAPRPFSWDRLIWMNRQWKGIVFRNFQNEKPPRFILDLVEELQREKIAESDAPCQTFAKSFMMIRPASKLKDLVLLLRPMNEETMSRLEQWRNNQDERIVIILSDYVKEYAAEFTGIEKSVKSKDDSAGKSEQKKDDSTKKSKKERRKKNHPSETSETANSNDDAVIETPQDETATTDDGTEKSDDGAEVSNESDVADEAGEDQ